VGSSQLGTDLSTLLAPFLTVAGTIFVAELTDKDALLLLALATRIRPKIAFAAGATAFTITTTIIVTAGYFLVSVVPVLWIRLVGGIVMIAFAIWQYVSTSEEASEEKKLLERTTKRTIWSVFLGAVSMLILLDLAGDATEVLTIVYVARFSNAFLVFSGAVLALVAASAVETLLGSRLKRYLSAKRLRLLSLLLFLVIGSYIILTSL
jgi:putative Ca2+/H+ antiporter (TMEM165/GDT1 family)